MKNFSIEGLIEKAETKRVSPDEILQAVSDAWQMGYEDGRMDGGEFPPSTWADHQNPYLKRIVEALNVEHTD